MKDLYTKNIRLAIALVAVCFTTPMGLAKADVIDVDLSQVDPSARAVIQQAEAFWETRIQAYSTELPRQVVEQLTSLQISAVVAPIDGPNGILGFAGPNGVISYELNGRFVAVGVTAGMTFDLDDFPGLAADGILLDVVKHEMAHAMGLGSLWFDNNLIEAVPSTGLIQYTGRYGLAGYRIESGIPNAGFVPLEQRGGPGTALGHWNDMPPFFNQVFTGPFIKEIMTGFACDFDPDLNRLVCAPKFVARASWGSFADLGFAVQGINDQFTAPRGQGTGVWPKTTGGTRNPFSDNGVPPVLGLRFSILESNFVYGTARGSKGEGVDDTGSVDLEDPYNLRKHRWAK